MMMFIVISCNIQSNHCGRGNHLHWFAFTDSLRIHCRTILNNIEITCNHWRNFTELWSRQLWRLSTMQSRACHGSCHAWRSSKCLLPSKLCESATPGSTRKLLICRMGPLKYSHEAQNLLKRPPNAIQCHVGLSLDASSLTTWTLVRSDL